MVTYYDSKRYYKNTLDRLYNLKDYKARQELVENAINYTIKYKDSIDQKACADFFVSAYVEKEDLEKILSNVEFNKYNKDRLNKKIDYLEGSYNKMDKAKKAVIELKKEYANPKTEQETDEFVEKVSNALKLTENQFIVRVIVDDVIEYAKNNKDLINTTSYASFVASNGVNKRQLKYAYDVLELSDKEKEFFEKFIKYKNTSDLKIDVEVVQEEVEKEELPYKPKIEAEQQSQTVAEKLDRIEKILEEYNDGNGKNYYQKLLEIDQIRLKGTVLERNKASKAISCLQEMCKLKTENKEYDFGELKSKHLEIIKVPQNAQQNKQNEQEKLDNKKEKHDITDMAKIEEEKKDKIKNIVKQTKEKTLKEKTPKELKKSEIKELSEKLQKPNCSIEEALYAYNAGKGFVYANILRFLDNEKLKAKTMAQKKQIQNAYVAFDAISKSISKKQELTFGEIDKIIYPQPKLKKEEVKQEIETNKTITEQEINKINIELENKKETSSSNLEYEQNKQLLIKDFINNCDEKYDVSMLANFVVENGNAYTNCNFIEKFNGIIEKSMVSLLEAQSFEDHIAKSDVDLHLRYLRLKGTNKTKHTKICIDTLNVFQLREFAFKNKDADLYEVYDKAMDLYKYATKNHLKDYYDNLFKDLDCLAKSRTKQKRQYVLEDSLKNSQDENFEKQM